jgi:hypothetical protein
MEEALENMYKEWKKIEFPKEYFIYEYVNNKNERQTKKQMAR